MHDFFLIFTLSPIVAAADNEIPAEVVPFFLLSVGFIYFGVMYARYRNADKRHKHETKTSATLANLKVADTFLRRSKNLSAPMQKGYNHTRIEGSLNKKVQSTEDGPGFAFMPTVKPRNEK